MKITDRIAHNALRVYAAQLIADRKKEEAKLKKRRKDRKKKTSIQSVCVSIEHPIAVK